MLSCITAQSQSIEGKIFNDKGQAIELAHVVLLALPDSSVIRQGVSDEQGQFSLKLEAQAIKPTAQYLLRISSVGYKTQQQLITASDSTLRITLSTDEAMLKEVIVEARSRGHQIDRRAFSFPRPIVQATQSSRDLLRFLPDLHVDILSGKISSITSGGKVVLLINGIEATVQQLKAIPSEMVKEIVYYDIPPARYADAGAVVDVLAPRLEQGIELGAEVLGTFMTGFADGSAFVKLNKGRQQFALEYSISHRDYTERIGQRSYRYELGGKPRQIEMRLQDNFGYTTHKPTLRYTHEIRQKQTLQLSLHSELESRHSGGLSDNVYTEGNTQARHRADIRQSSSYWSPILDLYYSRKLDLKRELTLNFLTAIYLTKASEYNHEQDASGSSVLQDDMSLRNRSTSLVGELAYRQQTGLGQWNTGYRFSSSHVDYDVQNIYGAQQYEVSNTKHYAYTELRGRVKKISYLLSLGLTHIDNRQDTYSYRKTLFTPSLVLSSPIAKGQSLRLQLSYTPSLPSTSWTSNNRISLVKGIIYRGNPELRNAGQYTARLRYTLEKKLFNLNAQLFAGHMVDAYVQDYRPTPSQDAYETSYTNAQAFNSLGGSLQLEVKPLGQLLSFRGFIEPKYSRLEMPQGHYGYFSIRNMMSLTFVYRKLSLQYGISFPQWTLSQGTLDRTHETHALYAQYAVGAWSFVMGLSVIASPTIYEGRTTPLSPMMYSYRTDIFDNKNMLLLGISYSLASGKQKQIQRSITNEASGATYF